MVAPTLSDSVRKMVPTGGKMLKPGSVEERELQELREKYSRVLPPGGGACINDIGPGQVTESLVCQYFGQKSSKSGWKYNCKQTEEEAASIYDLWQRVYDERIMPNKEITLQFARGLILQSKGIAVDWVEFAVCRERYRRGVRVSKGKTVGKVCDELGGLGARVSILGKKPRCLATTPPPLFQLTMKVEETGEEEMGKKLSPGCKRNFGGKALVGAPGWVSDEVLGMEVGIAGCGALTDELRAELLDSELENGRLEGEVRRAQIMLTDRRTFLVESQLTLKKLIEEEALLKARMSQIRQSLAAGGSCQALEESLIVDECRAEQIPLDKRIEERTMTLSAEVICSCEATITRVEGQLQKSGERVSVVKAKVSALVSVIGKMGLQLQRMQEGSGNIFFPRPIFTNPSMPLDTVHVLNACPVCELWYSCYNFVSLGCGHTYHAWCLSEHVLESDICLVKSCAKKIEDSSKASIGIRPIAVRARSDLNVDRKDMLRCTGSAKNSHSEFVMKKQGGETKQASENSPDVGWESRAAQEMGDPLSQCSETAVEIEAPNQNRSCMLCKTRSPTVLLKPCGHNRFCFSCVQSLRACPICKEGVVGWELEQPLPTVNPLLLSLGNEEDVAMDSMLAKKHVSKKRKAPVDPVVDVKTTVDTNSEVAHDTDDDEDEARPGIVEWCDDDLFKEGGRRSISIQRLGDTSTDKSEDQVQQPEAIESDDYEGPGSKQSRSVMTLSALGDREDTVGGVKACQSRAPPECSRKKPGRPKAASKAQKKSGLRNTQRPRLTIPAKFRDLP